jgi:uncharacterized protein YkwD
LLHITPQLITQERVLIRIPFFSAMQCPRYRGTRMTTSTRRRFAFLGSILYLGCWFLGARAQESAGQAEPQAARQLLTLANQARAQAGVGPLKWDDALAAAAGEHTQRMAAEGPIAHRYGGEGDLSTRAGKAGARFDLIEENVAVGPSAAEIHDQWMHSPGHRSNLLNADVNRVGIAVVTARGVEYATADYARSVEKLTQEQVESRIAELVRVSGVKILSDHSQARAACSANGALALAQGQTQPRFVMRWQDSDLKELPKPLAEKLASGTYEQAAIGNCPPQGVEGNFTAYRVAVLLF